jgi:hypothetical protein
MKYPYTVAPVVVQSGVVVVQDPVVAMVLHIAGSVQVAVEAEVDAVEPVVTEVVPEGARPGSGIRTPQGRPRERP